MGPETNEARIKQDQEFVFSALSPNFLLDKDQWDQCDSGSETLEQSLCRSRNTKRTLQRAWGFQLLGEL